MNPAIRVENLSKSFRIGARSAEYRTLREAVSGAVAAPWRRLRDLSRWGEAGGDLGGAADSDHFWALKDVSFEVQPGEVVGIIGRNGAGKSTLLKVLSRITEPTRGRAEFRGRIGSLLEVGTGFHPELTGRENIYLNGTILGMKRREIDRKFDEIVAFSEIEMFLDTPVKRYSSGMYVRLAFAVAAHLDLEVLLVDEVLAVGDASFQKKCMGKMRDVGRSGRTILFVSHNAAAIELLCERCVWIERGQVKQEAGTREILSSYYRMHRNPSASKVDLREHGQRTSRSQTLMTSVCLRDSEGHPVHCARMGESLRVDVDFEMQDRRISPVIGVVIKTDLGYPLFGVNNKFITGYVFDEVEGVGSIGCQLDNLPLMPGHYFIDLYFGNQESDLDVIHEAVSFEVVPADVHGSGKLAPAVAGPICWPATFDLRMDSGS